MLVCLTCGSSSYWVEEGQHTISDAKYSSGWSFNQTIKFLREPPALFPKKDKRVEFIILPKEMLEGYNGTE